MKALQVTAHGSPGEVLAVRTIPVPEPGPGEVRVEVGAASLNFNDIDRCLGKLVSVPTPPPFTLGMDVCGVVDAVGEGAEGWLGRRVVAITKTALGGIAEYAIAPAVSVFDAPDGLDDAEAAGFVLTFQASHLALFRRGRLQAGETLVVHSAASGLGTAGIQLGKAVGARIIAVAGGPEKGALCTSLGADLVIDHTAEDFVEAVLVATDERGADVVYDLTGGDFVERSWRCTARGGRYLAVGFADDDDNGMTGRPLRLACIGNIDIVGVMLAWADEVDPGMRRFGFNPFGRDVADEIHSQLLALVAEGKITPFVGRRVTMQEAGAALDDHQARRSLGRTVVVVSG
ncbi:MAG TPA: NADPH:quinone oxidoreductase family protein [Acidimicrobiales bacterium]|jgi:NADPH2:quinone reductase|nr:NADPH:quinone oxidoreductase family protein [Acidimicrobiales bacterium]